MLEDKEKILQLVHHENLDFRKQGIELACTIENLFSKQELSEVFAAIITFTSDSDYFYLAHENSGDWDWEPHVSYRYFHEEVLDSILKKYPELDIVSVHQDFIVHATATWSDGVCSTTRTILYSKKLGV